MKKVRIGAGLLDLTILLAGCGGNSTAKQASLSSSSTSQKVSSSHKQTTPWNSQKTTSWKASLTSGRRQ